MFNYNIDVNILNMNIYIYYRCKYNKYKYRCSITINRCKYDTSPIFTLILMIHSTWIDVRKYIVCHLFVPVVYIRDILKFKFISLKKVYQFEGCRETARARYAIRFAWNICIVGRLCMRFTQQQVCTSPNNAAWESETHRRLKANLVSASVIVADLR